MLRFIKWLWSYLSMLEAHRIEAMIHSGRGFN